MPKIHGPDGVVYSTPEKKQDGTQWAAFTDATQIGLVKDALGLMRDRVARIPACDQYFESLPRKKSFRTILDDPKVWISYDPTGPAAAETVGNYITLGKKALNGNRWQVVATLVHELAHVGGAEDIDGQAEKALVHCGLKDHYVDTNSTGAPSRAGKKP
jgi:hypothetical protein